MMNSLFIVLPSYPFHQLTYSTRPFWLREVFFLCMQFSSWYFSLVLKETPCCFRKNEKETKENSEDVCSPQPTELEVLATTTTADPNHIKESLQEKEIVSCVTVFCIASGMLRINKRTSYPFIGQTTQSHQKLGQALPYTFVS